MTWKEEARMVYLRSYFDVNRIVIMEGGSKREALESLIELSRSDQLIRDFQSFRKEVLKRESVVSTGIGMGIALPHVKTNSVRSFFITAGVFKRGVDWDSLDGKPVYIAFLIAGPEDHQQYLQILAKLTLIIRSEERRQALIASSSREAILEQFTDL
jgi:PTS system nitrogen regulatory IIA component